MIAEFFNGVIIDGMRTPIFELARRTLQRGGAGALNLIAPPACPVSGDRISETGGLSGAGWREIQFIEDPVCARCGVPFAHDHGEGAICGQCAADPPSYDCARAAALYEDACHRLIVDFKHRDRTDLTPLFSRWLARVGAALVDEGTIICPVPLHRKRLFVRRYNQAALLAHAFSKTLGRGRVEPALLQRVKSTPPQQRLSAAARKRNVSGAFIVLEPMQAIVKDASIVIVDDVLTTGATLSACARVLRQAGARRIDALVLARVVKDGVEAI